MSVVFVIIGTVLLLTLFVLSHFVPNEQDRRRAEARGVDPGGDLAIHGLPTRSEEEAWDYIERDWTDGCIAVTNDAMEEIWNLVDDGTPIEILP